jgi:hypothetical protein
MGHVSFGRLPKRDAECPSNITRAPSRVEATRRLMEVGHDEIETADGGHGGLDVVKTRSSQSREVVVRKADHRLVRRGLWKWRPKEKGHVDLVIIRDCG